MMNQTLQNKIRQKIRYKCWHRGTKEMDILLGNFYDKYNNDMSILEHNEFEENVVSMSDDDLYDIFINKKNWPPEVKNGLLKKLKKYTKNIGLTHSR